MRHHELSPPKGWKKNRRRKGRGDGSGRGTYSGRGLKGQNSRSGGGVRPGFEGGQLPLVKALPAMRGFTNIFRKEYNVVNVDHLARLGSQAEVTPEIMAANGLIRDTKSPVKVLGRGELDEPLVVKAHRFSDSARRKIEAAGGSVEEIAS
jgi:large subunit ribosomal protein L15